MRLQLKIKSTEIIKSIGKIRVDQFSCEKNFQELRKGMVYAKDLKKGSVLKKKTYPTQGQHYFFLMRKKKKC